MTTDGSMVAAGAVTVTEFESESARGNALRRVRGSSAELLVVTLLQGWNDLVDVPAHHTDVRVSRSRPEGVVVESRDDGRDARFLGERLGQFRVELRLR